MRGYFGAIFNLLGFPKKGFKPETEESDQDTGTWGAANITTWFISSQPPPNYFLLKLVGWLYMIGDIWCTENSRCV